MKSTLHHWFKSLFPAAVALGLLSGNGNGLLPRAQGAADPATAEKPSLPDDEAKAWTTVQDANKPPTPPAEWREKRPSKEDYEAWLGKQSEKQLVAADTAKEFWTRFPKSAHAAEAHKLQLRALSTAAQMGNTARETELAQLMNAAATDPSIPENDRVDVRVQKLRLEAGKAAKAGSQEDAKKVYLDGLLALQKDFPKNDKVCGMLLNMAMSEEGDTQKTLAKAVATSADAPEKLKQKAQAILDGKVFSAANNVGKPVAIKFTAVDGREVDLAKLKGKVVLVDFWATWCGPCVAEIPRVVEAYNKYHDKGFEIVGISFDREGDKAKLIKFTKDKEMPWPQYFDGKYWENEFGQQFNIRSIPAMWLIGKDGNLADVEAREDLAGKVAKLLEAK